MTARSAGVGDCVFCGIVAGRVPCAQVFEDATTFAFMDIEPGADGHVLVIPKLHSTDLFDVSTADLAATTLVAQRIAKAAPSALGADGVNLLNCSGVAAHQTVFHYHLHVIPRYDDPTKGRLGRPFEPAGALDAGADVLVAHAASIASAL